MSTRELPPIPPPRDLTLPEPGSATVRDLLVRFLGLTRRRLAQVLSARYAEPRALEVERTRYALASASAAEPGLLPALLRRPSYSVRVQCLHGALSGESPAPAERIDAWIADLCAATLFELALCRRLPDDGVRIDRPIARLTSVAHRLSLAFDPPPRAIRFAPGRLDLETPRGSAEVPLRGEPPPGATASRPFHAIDDGAVLALVDSNPLALIEAHPEKHGNAVDLGGHPVEEWVSTLRGAIDLVARYLPGIRQEMRLLLQEVVPVGYDPERHLSASYREAVGLVYLSLHPNLLTMTEALIHEFQHNKLNMLWTLAPLLENAFSPLFRSPVRPDPRPLHGVLLAVHAFQPVARLYEEMDRAGDPRLRSPDVRRRYAQVIAQNREACEVLLPSSQATDAGRALLEEIARWDAHYASIRV